MSLVPPTVVDLANFTGRASNSFGSFAQEALAQATLLFYLATGLSEYPNTPELLTLSQYGIMDMADKIYLGQQYAETKASPFQSETIGSYSYSKLTNSVKKGNDTGVTWFDIAVQKLKSASERIAQSGSIEGMEYDGLGVTGDGKYKIIGASGTHSEHRNPWDIDTFEDITHHHIF